MRFFSRISVSSENNTHIPKKKFKIRRFSEITSISQAKGRNWSLAPSEKLLLKNYGTKDANDEAITDHGDHFRSKIFLEGFFLLS